jgi:hypothetical protein
MRGRPTKRIPYRCCSFMALAAHRNIGEKRVVEYSRRRAQTSPYRRKSNQAREVANAEAR